MFKELTMGQLLREVPEGGLGVSIYLPKTGYRVENTKLKAQLQIVHRLLEGRVSNTKLE